MKIYFLVLILLLYPLFSRGQDVSSKYSNNIFIADSLYDLKEYKASSFAYSNAFEENGWKGKTLDSYSAACSWALAGIADSAFYYLNLIANETAYAAYNDLKSDEDLISIHGDDRWQSVLKTIKDKNIKTGKSINRSLALELDSIFDVDQHYRKISLDYEKKYGGESKEMKDLWKTISEKDSMNLIKVTAIIEKYGWLGSDVVGERGNMTLFLVIQHADLQTQEKYLPMMKQAVKDGNAKASSLALLVDRVEMRNKRPQIYGSQITFDNNKYVVYPIIDEPNVNKRRAEVGLEPLEKYLKNWNIFYETPTR